MREFRFGFSALRQLLAEIIALLESVNASAAVNKLLLAGKERVALRADFDLDIGLCGTRFDYVSASALNRGRLICGMNSLFHYSHLI